MKQANNNQLFLLDDKKTYQDPMPFFMQPMMALSDGLVFGFEILFRGATPYDWTAIDKSVARHLCDSPPNSLPIMFVNISGKAFLDIPHEQFIEASQRNKIYFELSEALANDENFEAINAKIDALTANGVLFAIDNFGSNPDTMKQVFALDDISVIKVDGALICHAMQHTDAAQALRTLIERWHAMKIVSVAERVETAAMLAFAKQMQFDFVQGFHIDALLSGLDVQDLDSAA